MLPVVLNSKPFYFLSRNFIFILIIVALTMAPHVSAGFGFNLDGSLDKEAISHAYFEGDFHRILAPLEAFRTSKVQKAKEDSIFVFKYLSVIYAADSSTLPKAESYMVQLVKMKPTIELIDLYISDNIEAIFTGVKKNYLKQQQYINNYDVLGNEKTSPASAKSASKPHSSKWVWWTIGGIGIALTVAVGYYALHEDSNSSNDSKGFKP
jgi:hypothetical protein